MAAPSSPCSASTPAAPARPPRNWWKAWNHLQVLYGERIGTQNIRYRTAPNVTNWGQVVAVKLALLVASRDPVLDVADATAGYALLDQTVAKTGTSGAAITYPNDRRLRRVFAATVNVRNRRDL